MISSLFAVLMIFYTLQILSSPSTGEIFVLNVPTSPLRKNPSEAPAQTYVNDYDFWTKYYNDDRFGRMWDFNISQKYDNSELHEYKRVIVERKDAGRPGEMGKSAQNCYHSRITIWENHWIV